MKKFCSVCGREFETVAGNKKYCSADCAAYAQGVCVYLHTHRRRKIIPKVIKCVCVECGKKFKSSASTTKYCSPHCQGLTYFKNYERGKLRIKRLDAN